MGWRPVPGIFQVSVIQSAQSPDERQLSEWSCRFTDFDFPGYQQPSGWDGFSYVPLIVCQPRVVPVLFRHTQPYYRYLYGYGNFRQSKDSSSTEPSGPRKAAEMAELCPKRRKCELQIHEIAASCSRQRKAQPKWFAAALLLT
jgi:hypothetical protein